MKKTYELRNAEGVVLATDELTPTYANNVNKFFAARKTAYRWKLKSSTAPKPRTQERS